MQLDNCAWFNGILFENGKSTRMNLKPNFSRKDMLKMGCPHASLTSIRKHKVLIVSAYKYSDEWAFTYLVEKYWTYVRHDKGELLSMLEMIE